MYLACNKGDQGRSTFSTKSKFNQNPNITWLTLKWMSEWLCHCTDVPCAGNLEAHELASLKFLQRQVIDEWIDSSSDQILHNLSGF